MSMRIKLNFQPTPENYDYAVEVILGRNNWGVIVGNTAWATPTTLQILEAVKSDVKWELDTQGTQYSSIDWVVNEVTA